MSLPPRGSLDPGSRLIGRAEPVPGHRVARVALIGAAALVLTACPGGEPSGGDDGGTATAGPSPVAGGTLRAMFASDVDSLDPHLAARPSSWWFARAIHRGLYAFPDLPGEPGGAPVPDLAEAMPSFSADGRIATIRLREGVSFSDEQPVTAGAVRASLQRLMRAGVGVAVHLVPHDGVPGGIEAIEVVDPMTVRIRLARAANDLMWLLAHPQAAIVPVGAIALPAPPLSLSGAGPYRLATYRPERRIVLERNPSWSRDLDPVRGAWVDQIDARLGVDRREARADVATGTAHVIVDPGPPDRPAGRAPDGARVERVSAGCTRYLFMDNRVAPFSNGRARLAVAHAVDRGAFVDGADAAAAAGLLPPTVDGAVTEVVLAEDLSRARALLAQANLADGFRAGMIVGDSPRDLRDAGRVRDALARVGIDVRITAVPPASVYPLYYDDPDERIAMGIATWCPDWPGRAGRSVLLSLAGPRRLGEPRVPARPGAGGGTVRRAIDAALQAGDDEVTARWAAADAAVIRTAVLVPLSWPDDEVTLGAVVRGWAGSPAFPRGDPTGMWLGAPPEA